MRVSAVLGSATFGGAEQWLADLSAEPGHVEMEVIALASGPAAERFAHRGDRVTVIPTGTSARAVATSALRLARHLRRERPDVVVANGVKAATVAIPAGVLSGARTVWARHDFVWDEVLGRRLARWADSVVGTSQELVDAVRPQHGSVIPPPWPSEPASRAEARRVWAERGVRFDGPTLATVSRLIGYKGIDDAIGAIAATPDWRLVVVGDDDPTAPGHRAELEALADQLGSLDRVVFAGPVEDAGRYLAAFDAVAVLTKRAPGHRYEREGFSIVALEAVAAGVPVVATRGTPALGVLGGAAVGVSPGAPEEVAHVLRAWAADPPDLAGIVEELRCRWPDRAAASTQLASHLAEVARRAGAHTTVGGPPLSVVTTVLNERDAVLPMLTRVTEQLGDGDEVVVIDGGSTDGTIDLLEAEAGADPRIRVIVSEGANISRGRNIGIEAAANDHIAVTDAGCVPDPGWLDALRRGFTTQPTPALVTGVYRVSTDTVLHEASSLSCYPDPDEALHPTPLVRAAAPVFGKSFLPSMPTGRSVAFTRDAWRRAGGFREDLPTAEDVTFGRAIVAAGGHAVLTVDASVTWRQRESVRATWKMFHRYGFDGARSGDRLLIARDLARGAAYAVGAIALVGGGQWGRRLALLGAAAYCTPATARGLRKGASPGAVVAAPVTLVLKDLAKASGCARGLVVSVSERTPISGSRRRGR